MRIRYIFIKQKEILAVNAKYIYINYIIFLEFTRGDNELEETFAMRETTGQ